MTTPTVNDVMALYELMMQSPPESPGALRRRLPIQGRSVHVHLEVSFPDLLRGLVVRTPDPVEPEQVQDTAHLRCEASHHTVRIAAGPAVEPDMFCTLVVDLVGQLSVDSPGRALTQRLRSWQRMLAAGLRTGLTPTAQLGLFGELLVFRELALAVWPSDAARAWIGPTGAPQDFRLGTAALEVKSATDRNSTICRITNEDQLDDTELEYLGLVHQRFANRSSNGVTLPDLVDALRAEPAVQATIDQFEDRLLHAGWLDLHRAQYDRDRYALVGRRAYHVVGDFPRLVGAQLPPGVRKVSYNVDLSETSQHFVSEAVLLGALESATGRAQL